MKTGILILGAAMAVNGAALAGELTVQPISEQLQQNMALVTKVPKGIGQPFVQESEPVMFSWQLEESAELNFEQPAFVQSSKQYFLTVSSNDLAEGVTLHTTSPGAFVRVSPLNSAKAGAFDAPDFQLSTAGKWQPSASGMQKFVDSDALQAAGMDVVDRSVAFQINPGLGQGQIGLRIANQAKLAGGSFVVHVQEPDSPFELQLQANNSQFMTGDMLQAQINMTSMPVLDVANAKALLTDPAGNVAGEFALEQTSGGLIATMSTKGLSSNTPGLWEVHLYVDQQENGMRVMRDATTAVAIAQPTAQLKGVGDQHFVGQDMVQTSFKVEAGLAGRYELRGVLFATDQTGDLVPVAVGHSAKNLGSGAGTIPLRFELGEGLGSAFGAPFEVRHLELNDQSMMQKLVKIERAVALEHSAQFTDR